MQHVHTHIYTESSPFFVFVFPLLYYSIPLLLFKLRVTPHPCDVYRGLQGTFLRGWKRLKKKPFYPLSLSIIRVGVPGLRKFFFFSLVGNGNFGLFLFCVCRW